jgi:hypothetical protein
MKSWAATTPTLDLKSGNARRISETASMQRSTSMDGIVQTTCMGVKRLRASLLEELTYREFMQELHVTIQFQIKIKIKQMPV